MGTLFCVFFSNLISPFFFNFHRQPGSKPASKQARKQASQPKPTLDDKHPKLCCFKSAVGGYPDRCLHVKYGGGLCGYGTVVQDGSTVVLRYGTTVRYVGMVVLVFEGMVYSGTVYGGVAVWKLGTMACCAPTLSLVWAHVRLGGLVA
jgi:hypothetical protein